MSSTQLWTHTGTAPFRRRAVTVLTALVLAGCAAKKAGPLAPPAPSSSVQAATTVTVATPSTVAPTTTAQPGLTVTRTGFTRSNRLPGIDFTLAPSGVAIANPSAQLATLVSVTLALKDAAGNVMGTSRSALSYIAAGRTAYVGDSINVPNTDNPTQLTATVTVGRFEARQVPEFPVTQVRLLSTLGTPKFTGNVKNTLGHPTKMRVDCVALQGTTIIGGAFAFTEAVPADGSAAFSAGSAGSVQLQPSEVACSAATYQLSGLDG